MLPHQVCRCTLHENLPVVHDDQPVTEPCCLVEIVGGEDDGISLRPEGPEFFPHQVPGLRVEPDGWLVEDEDIRVIDKRPGKDQAAFHSAGEFLYRDVAFLHKLDECEQLICFFRSSFIRNIEILCIHEQVTEAGEVGVEVRFLRDDAETGLDFDRSCCRVHAEHGKVSRGFRRDTGDHLHSRGLAGTVRAEKPEDFSLLYSKCNPVDRESTAIGLL